MGLWAMTGAPKLTPPTPNPSSPNSPIPMSATPAISGGLSRCTAIETCMIVWSSANRFGRSPVSTSAAYSLSAASATSMGCGFGGGPSVGPGGSAGMVGSFMGISTSAPHAA